SSAGRHGSGRTTARRDARGTRGSHRRGPEPHDCRTHPAPIRRGPGGVRARPRRARRNARISQGSIATAMSSPSSVRYLTADELWAMNDGILQQTGGYAILGDRRALEAAAMRPQTLAYYEGADLVTQAAALITA